MVLERLHEHVTKNGLARIEDEIKNTKNEGRGFFCFLVSAIMLGVCYTGAGISEPKRPVSPSLAMERTDCGLGWIPWMDGSCGVRPDCCPGQIVGTAGVLGGAIH